MAMKSKLVLLFALSACGTLQEQCIASATRDMRVVDRLISETEGNIARGYAYENVTVFSAQWLDCTPRATAQSPDPKPKICLEQVPETTKQAVAIDLNVEAAKLSSLQAKRLLQSNAAAAQITRCKAEHPE